MKISEAFKNIKITAAEGDTSTTIAQLAQFVEFDIYLSRKYDTAPWCVAYDTLLDEYGGHEFVDGHSDYYDGVWMKFVDGSRIQFGG